jgi:fluoroacetyl-CoA thioesterase
VTVVASQARSRALGNADRLRILPPMNARIAVGTEGQVQFTVEPKHTIDFNVAGLVPVLSTPSLVWFLEHAGIEALQPGLQPGEISVGTDLEVQHVAPTPVGLTVTCLARVVQTDGPVISFHVEAHDGSEPIARGFHKRRIIRAESFSRRLQAKPAN